jgi:hypothetical protein
MVSNGVLPDFFWINQDTNVGFCCLLCHHLLLFSANNGPKIRMRSRVAASNVQVGDNWSSTSRITTWPTKTFTLHWINNIILNNKCIFTQLNAVFNTQNGCMNKNILLQLILSQNTRSIQQTPNLDLCSTAVP